MRATVVPGPGAPWTPAEVATPEPGPGQLLVRIEASGVCHNDVLAARGEIPFPSCDPAIPGHEPVGRVVATGPGTTLRAVGDRVGATWVRSTCGECDYCRAGGPATGAAAFLCAAPVTTGFSAPGGQAEYLVLDEAEAHPVPENVPAEEAAAVLCAGFTAWGALKAARPAAGERIAVVGIGGVGHLALQYAVAAGLDTVGVTSSTDKRGAVEAAGAEAVVGSGAELAAAGGADVVVVTGPSHDIATACFAGLRPGGRLVLAGFDVNNPLVIPPAAQFPFFAFGQQVLGATHGTAADLQAAFEPVAAGKVRPVVERFPARNVADAFVRTAKGEARFRSVVGWTDEDL